MGQYEETVKLAARRFRKAEAAIKQARSDLVVAVVEALRDGDPPTEVAGWSTFTTTYVRTLARKHEIPPSPHRGPRRGTDA